MTRRSRWSSGGERSGFTLLELLVVIALVVVVIAILLSYLNRARETADRVHCRKTLRAIGQALLLYANDNHGVYPRTAYAPGPDPKPVWGTGADGKDPGFSVSPNDVSAAMFMLLAEASSHSLRVSTRSYHTNEIPSVGSATMRSGCTAPSATRSSQDT